MKNDKSAKGEFEGHTNPKKRNAGSNFLGQTMSQQSYVMVRFIYIAFVE